MYGLAATTDQSLLYCGGPLAPFYPSCWSNAWDSLFGSPSQLAPPPAPTGTVLTTPPASGADAQATIDQLLNQQMAAQQALAGSQANPSYGLTFWLNSQAPNGREADFERMLDLPWQSAPWNGVCICKDAPPDMVVALGSHYQRLFIIPSLKAVIVRQGSEAKFSDAHFLRLLLGKS